MKHDPEKKMGEKLPTSAYAGRPDYGLHVVQIGLKLTTPNRRQGVLGFWHPSLERLPAGDVSRLF